MVRTALHAVMGPIDAAQAEEGVDTYFSPSYKQYTDAEVYDFSAFKQHIRDITTGLQSIDLQLLRVIGSSEPVEAENRTRFQVGTFHHVNLVYEDKSVSAHVIGVSTVEGGKNVEAHEVLDSTNEA